MWTNSFLTKHESFNSRNSCRASGFSNLAIRIRFLIQYKRSRNRLAHTYAICQETFLSGLASILLTLPAIHSPLTNTIASTQADLKTPRIAKDVLAEAATSHLAIQHGPRPKHFCTYRREAPSTPSTHNSWNSPSHTVIKYTSYTSHLHF